MNSSNNSPLAKLTKLLSPQSGVEDENAFSLSQQIKRDAVIPDDGDKSPKTPTKSDAENARLLSEQQTLSQEKTKLKEQIDILTAEKITLEQENSQLKLNLKKSDSSPESVPVTVCQDTWPRDVLTDQSDDIKKSLLVGSSIVQDIRAKSSDNLDVIFKRGGTLNTVKNILRQTSMTK